jgi:hypothetical protein
MVKFNATFKTAGDGYWSKARRAVRVTDIDVPYINDEKDFGELCVYFDTKTWDVEKDGLIYTDGRFLMELTTVLAEAGFDVSDVSYSEQGMQGDNFVSLDVGKAFLGSWFDIVGTTLEA